jgi:hypothetical protein
MKTPLLSTPLTFHALVSTTVTRSEATTFRRSGASDSLCPTRGAASGAADAVGNPIAVLAIAAQDAAIPLNTVLRSSEIGTERSSRDSFLTPVHRSILPGLVPRPVVVKTNGILGVPPSKSEDMRSPRRILARGLTTDPVMVSATALCHQFSLCHRAQ